MAQTLKLRVVGMKKHHYIGEVIEGHNCYFTYKEEPMTEYIICLSGEEARYELSLSESFGECPSGWTTASFGHADLRKLSEGEPFGGITHVPKKDLDSQIEYPLESKKYECIFFEYDSDGGERYYPVGSVCVNEESFEETGRGFPQVPVWIFYGPSNLGKSYIAHLVEDKIVFESDAYDTLPEKIAADIVVIGNKHGYTLEDVSSRIDGHKIPVKFGA